VSYDAQARRQLAEALRLGQPLLCPACGTPLTRHAVEPRAELPYVRRRVVVICSACRRSAALDVTADGRP
jgi:hypothetical protein